MPHIVLEYSANLYDLPSFSALFAEIHQVLHREGGIRLENCKSRARAAHHYFIADGSPDHAFVHLNIEFVKGRSDERRVQFFPEARAQNPHAVKSRCLCG